MNLYIVPIKATVFAESAELAQKIAVKSVHYNTEPAIVDGRPIHGGLTFGLAELSTKKIQKQ